MLVVFWRKQHFLNSITALLCGGRALEEIHVSASEKSSGRAVEMRSEITSSSPPSPPPPPFLFCKKKKKNLPPLVSSVLEKAESVQTVRS